MSDKDLSSSSPSTVSVSVSVSVSQSASSIADPNEWRERIRSVQTQRMSPEAFQAMRARADRQKEVEKARKTASLLERVSHVSMRAQETNLARSSNLRQYQQQQQQYEQFAPPAPVGANVFRFSSALSAPAAMPTRERERHAHREREAREAREAREEVDREYERMTATNAMRSATMRSILTPVAMSSPAMTKSATKQKKSTATATATASKAIVVESESDEEEVEEADFAEALAAREQALDALEQEVASEERDVRSAAPATTTDNKDGSASSDFHTLLQSLAEEPTDGAETVAKFSIYETFLETVVAIREQTVALWSESRAQFEDSARLAGDQEIRRIDCAETMSVFEHAGYSRRWFVYDMMKKAHQNHALISRILASIRGKLELLAQEDVDCPFCLEVITAENALVLGCCHKTCKTCWTHWKELKGGRAFCPLCRHQEFVVELLA